MKNLFAYLLTGKKINVDRKTVQLKKGANQVLIAYDKACATYLIFRKLDVLTPVKKTVAMCWYGDSGVLPFDCSHAFQVKSGLYYFNSAPGLQSLSFAAYGDVSVWIDGEEAVLNVIEKKSDGQIAYTVDLKNTKASASRVVFKIDYKSGN